MKKYFFLFFLLSFLTITHDANALTWGFGNNATVNTNKTVYSPGEAIVLSGSFNSALCSNSSPVPYYMKAEFLGTEAYIIQTSVSAHNVYYGTANLIAPMTPGTHRIHLWQCYYMTMPNDSYAHVSSLLFNWWCPIVYIDITVTPPPLLPAPMATIDAFDCIILEGSSSCSTSVTWSTAGIAGPSIRQNGVQFSIAGTGSNVSRMLTHGVHTFTVYDGTTQRATDDSNATCAPGSSWNGSVCAGTISPAPALTLSASPISINAGNSSTIQWTVTGTADSCWASGGWTGWKTFSGTDNEIVSPLITTTYNLECWDSGVSSGQKSVTVNVVPYACTSIPANTTMCPNDDSGLTGNTGATLIATPSSCTIPTACEYYCSIGFKNQGSTCIPTQCNDGIDNDGDTFTDGGDSGCTSIADDNETNVVGAPTISANPRYVEVGQQTTLTWDTNGNSGCTLTANDTVVPAVDPNLVTMHNPSINARTTYTLICPPYDPASVMVEVVSRQFES